MFESVCAGLLSLAGALTYAQLAAMIPRAGGEYAFLRTTLGELPAFLFGWMRLTVSIGTCAALAVAVIVFLSDLVPLGQPWVQLPVPWPHTPLLIEVGLRQVLAVLIILSLAVLNLRGVGHAGRFQAAVTILKVIGLFGLIVGVLAWGTPLAPRRPITPATRLHQSIPWPSVLPCLAPWWPSTVWS